MAQKRSDASAISNGAEHEDSALRNRRTVPAARWFAFDVKSDAGKGLTFNLFSNANDIDNSFPSSQIDMRTFSNGDDMSDKSLDFISQRKAFCNSENVRSDLSNPIECNNSVSNPIET
jgi:hypothetical protein